MKKKSSEAKKVFIYSLISISTFVIGITIAVSSKGIMALILSFSLLVAAIVISFFARKDVSTINKKGSAKEKRIAKFAVVAGKMLEIILVLVIVGGVSVMLFRMFFLGNL